MYYIVYPILWLLSFLPFWVWYGISDFFHFIIYRLVKYRKDVVLNNLLIAFPEKTVQEREQIAIKFYSNLIDAFVESIKFITVSKSTIQKRASANLDELQALLDKGRNIHLMAGHQFNWEFANLLFVTNLNKPFIGIYMPISNKVLDRIFYKFRGKFGTILISAKAFKSKMHTVFNQQYMLGLAADQNPGDPNFAYWTTFFGKPAPFVTGPAKGAVKNNTAIMMVGFEKIKRGYYHFDCKLIAENGADYTPQQLTLLYRDALEATIKKDPTNYLWSHRRWKYDYKPEFGNFIG